MDIKKLIKKLETKIAHSDDKLKIVVDVTDLQTLIQEIKNKDADLYETNNRIVDYMSIIEERDKLIDLMAEDLKTPIHSEEWIKKYYEERCK